MRPEYVRLQRAEKVYGEKNLLHAQLEIISISNKFEKYKGMRNSELALKVALKNKIGELKELLVLFERLLPKPLLKPQKAPVALAKPRHSLEQEVEEIRRKLAQLR
ncbi:MAG TPA: hypothetical protein VJK03_01350 [Candidatus Nanoarchaeia archaeon]|nr:hypothetical protein [Candidatus Nanoarchaeia archaeon]